MVTARFAVVGLGFVNSVVTARLLQPDGRGAYAIIMAVLSLFGVIVGSGGTAVALSAAHESEDSKRVTLTNSAGLAVILGFVPLILAPLWPGDSIFRSAVLLASIAMPFQLFTNSAQYAFLGAGRLKWLALMQIGQAAVAVVLGVVLIGVVRYGLRGATLAWTISWVVVCLAAFSGLRHWGWRFRLSDVAWAKAVRLLRFGVTSAVPGALSYAGNRALLFLIQMQLGIRLVGVYSVSLTIAEPISTVSTGLSAASYPRLIPMSTRARVASTFIQVAILFSLVLAVFLVAATRFWLTPVFGSAYSTAAGPLIVLLLAYVVLSGRDIAIYYCLHQTRSYAVPISASLGGFIATVLSAWPLVGWFGIEGAALSVLAGASVTMLGMVLGMRRLGFAVKELVSTDRVPLELSENSVLRSVGRRALAWVSSFVRS